MTIPKLLQLESGGSQNVFRPVTPPPPPPVVTPYLEVLESCSAHVWLEQALSYTVIVLIGADQSLDWNI